MTLPPDYENRVYAGWLGKCIGVRFGAPIENWTYEDIRDNLGELTTYVREDQGKIFKPDDDTAVPMVLIRALQDYGPDPTPQQFGDTLLNYLGDQHGTFWWGGYGVSTEHTAYLNLANSIPAPRSGSIAQNGATVAEQIGGQIFSDSWGWVAPNNPARAADLAAKAASVTHDGNGIYGGRFIAGLVSAAFTERDPLKLLQTGLSLIPADSDYARVIHAMIAWHREHPDDWRAAFAHLKAHFGYDRYGGVVHIIPNAGVIALGLLYGGGDFSRTLQITNMCGWDTDCNVGNVGAIMGTALGVEGIDESWRIPINDLLIASSLIGTRNLLTIPQCVDLFVSLAKDADGERFSQGRRPATTSATPARPTISQRAANADARSIWRNHAGALRTSIRKLNKKGEIRVFTCTYYRPSELSGNFYEACFTPLIAPGQVIEARVRINKKAPDTIHAAIYVHDDHSGANHQAQAVPLTPGEWQSLNFSTPTLSDACFSEVGIVLHNLGEVWETGSVQLRWLDWGGPPSYTTTFAKERPESGGISQWTRLRGYWRLEDGAYHGSGVGECESYSGDIEWSNYALEVALVPLIGDHHNIHVRVQGALRSYAFGLAPNGCVALYKKDKTYQPVATAPFAWQSNTRYTLRLTVKNNTLTATVTAPDGAAQTLTWADDLRDYQHGQIGLSTWHGGHTRFESVRLTPT
ncbi:MAG: ADP-ribosylglycohydrolase family protein [Chloroflexi bacterium]|uniref:ADP-ribosylglycohydrolase family protein n=1 Tax=Candidatus Flexifilum breve TaxID=3140694 RepID=UPI003135241A|nr:ADP-ribosylglycohydrolase family protein [Chloroflexota bacterium]